MWKDYEQLIFYIFRSIIEHPQFGEIEFNFDQIEVLI